ncbi:hypothetical protein V1639_13555 [Pseudarthrobacter sp. J75]|uniref:hypothetical protein n=1 Tax=unclassified Pseudarthrobacter TaxID=2647000 RepID=UPI002E813131|nr:MULTISPECIES: hypothetical protein [unclassified Pseudarthrobacter]MEE2523655.1 hypothetical protein [Pseudarthrobacter sp. J47]MEE2530046.1 hypothetical protein [Pseudarthrobacter sp. J75]MEE2570544.1 hypothetical protein [Pseudarthrobacter sp. J64]
MNAWPGNGLGGWQGSAGGQQSEQLRMLAGRIAQCADEGERIVARLQGIQLMDWQSPAGRAYRDSVGRQSDALRRAGHLLQAARSAVSRHAEAVAAAKSESAAGGFPW